MKLFIEGASGKETRGEGRGEGGNDADIAGDAWAWCRLEIYKIDQVKTEAGLDEE